MPPLPGGHGPADGPGGTLDPRSGYSLPVCSQPIALIASDRSPAPPVPTALRASQGAGAGGLPIPPCWPEGIIGGVDESFRTNDWTPRHPRG